MSETRIEYTGNIQVHHPGKPEVENPRPCDIQCGQPAACWGCE